MTKKEKVLTALKELGISYELHEHPAAPTVEIAKEYWKSIPGKVQHCKNLFFRNHKGNQHYLVIMDCDQTLSIHDLEQRLKQGKLSFASEERLFKYLGLSPGSVSLFGLMNDETHHVHLFIDKNLEHVENISFHPNDNTASLVIKGSDVHHFLQQMGNKYEFITLY